MNDLDNEYLGNQAFKPTEISGLYLSYTILLEMKFLR